MKIHDQKWVVDGRYNWLLVEVAHNASNWIALCAFFGLVGWGWPFPPAPQTSNAAKSRHLE